MVKTLIVGRTKKGTQRCIGGLTAEGHSIRLLGPDGAYWDQSAPFQVGQTWDLTLQDVAAEAVRIPHVEDAIVAGAQFVANDPDPRATILSRIVPWNGSTSALFGGHVKYTGNHNGYIEESGLPDRSTWFWVPDRDLMFRSDGKHYDYPSRFFNIASPQGLSYVGEPQAVATIPAGTLVRVSLAGWWRPDDADEGFPYRCYLQLSGWF